VGQGRHARGSLHGIKADIYVELPRGQREAFLDGEIQAAHFTAFGICLHDFAITPVLSTSTACEVALTISAREEIKRSENILFRSALPPSKHCTQPGFVLRTTQGSLSLGTAL